MAGCYSPWILSSAAWLADKSGPHDAVWKAIHGKTKGTGVLDQYFTPPDVALAMVAPFAKRRIYDPCCGSGNLLVAAGFLAAKEGLRGKALLGSLWGNDKDPTQREVCIRRLCRLLRTWHGDDLLATDLLSRQITCVDFRNPTLNPPPDAVVVANPPYSEWELFMNIFSKTEGAFLVPVSVGDSSRTACIRGNLSKHNGLVCVSFDTRPSPLFKGVEQRLMLIHATTAAVGHWVSPFLCHTRYDREKLWWSMEMTKTKLSAGVWPKLSPHDTAYHDHQLTSEDRYKPGNRVVWVRTTGRYKLAAAWEPPNQSSKWKPVFLTEEDAARLYVAFHTGEVYRWWRIYGNGRDFPLVRFLREYAP